MISSSQPLATPLRFHGGGLRVANFFQLLSFGQARDISMRSHICHQQQTHQKVMLVPHLSYQYLIYTGYVVTGGQETVINVFSLDSSREEPSYSLLGHTENVCTLDVTPGGSIISGSWDKRVFIGLTVCSHLCWLTSRTAKIWINFQLAYDLKGHQQSVWAVKAIDEEQSLTGRLPSIFFKPFKMFWPCSFSFCGQDNQAMAKTQDDSSIQRTPRCCTWPDASPWPWIRVMFQW